MSAATIVVILLVSLVLACAVGGPPPDRWSWRHKDPPWARERGVDVGAVAARHLIRGHRGEALLCSECVEDSR